MKTWKLIENITNNSPFILVEGKQVSIGEKMFLNPGLRRIRPLPDAHSSTRSNIDEY